MDGQFLACIGFRFVNQLIKSSGLVGEPVSELGQSGLTRGKSKSVKEFWLSLPCDSGVPREKEKMSENGRRESARKDGENMEQVPSPLNTTMSNDYISLVVERTCSNRYVAFRLRCPIEE